MTSSLDPIDDVELSLKGMTYLLNNKWVEAKSLFEHYRDDSALMCVGSSMVIFMQALMSFEEEQLKTAFLELQDTKKKCDSSKSFTLSRMRKTSSKRKQGLEMEDKLQRQIIFADCVIYQAVLTFLNQDIASYIKGGWMMRKAYKMYEKLYKEIRKYHNKYKLRETSSAAVISSSPSEPEVGVDALVVTENSHTAQAANAQAATSASGQDDEDELSMHDPSGSGGGGGSMDSDTFTVAELRDGELSREAVERLYGAVSFGYGTFQIAISLIPAKILRIIEFLGFEGDRETGLECLDVCSHSRDMKAPLASLGLIWYHTVIRPFFALDGPAVAVGVEDAYRIIARSEERYPNSALFLFFKGRAQRLTAELEKSRGTYLSALTSCEGQREVQLICYHELGWIAMMQFDWKESVECFTRLKEQSRWSKSYYTYLTGICRGAGGDTAAAMEHFRETPKLVQRKNNQIEAFVLKRAERLTRQGSVAPDQCCLLVLEVLYLWNALSQCPPPATQRMLTMCESICEPALLHMRDLVQGALLAEDPARVETALQCFRSAIARVEALQSRDDTHVAAYSTCELGLRLAGEPETYAEGRALLVRARDGFKEYDFDNRLSVRVNAALKRLKTEGTPL